MGLSLYHKLRHLLAQRWDDAEEAPPVFQLDDYPQMVRRLFLRTQRPRYGDPRCIAHECGLRLLSDHVEGCYGEVFDGETIAFSRKGGPRDWGLRIYHGISHHVLDTTYDAHEESDAWLLTIEMACAGTYLLNNGADKVNAEQQYAPLWLPRLYLEHLEQIAAYPWRPWAVPRVSW